jgi:HPt (histidine-containing phosphotransfer) domain-containing protein
MKKGYPKPDMRLPILDRERLDLLRAYQVEGGPDLVDGVVKMFLLEVPPLISEMQTAVASKDVEKIRHGAHTIKASSGNLGAKRISAFCARLEHLGRLGRKEGFGQALAHLEVEFEHLRKALEREIRSA